MFWSGFLGGIVAWIVVMAIAFAADTVRSLHRESMKAEVKMEALEKKVQDIDSALCRKPSLKK